MNCTPRNILKKKIASLIYLIDSPELEQEFVQYMHQSLGVELATSRNYLLRSNMQDNVAIALQEFIHAKTGKIVLISELRAYKFMLVYQADNTPSFALHELGKVERKELESPTV